MKIRLILLGMLLAAMWITGCDYLQERAPAKRDKQKIEKDFRQFYEELKTARQKGDSETALRFFPRDEKVLHIRNGEFLWLSYADKREEYQKETYATVTDVEGPYIMGSRLRLLHLGFRQNPVCH